jgi:hypothetical protein
MEPGRWKRKGHFGNHKNANPPPSIKNEKHKAWKYHYIANIYDRPSYKVKQNRKPPIRKTPLPLKFS